MKNPMNEYRLILSTVIMKIACNEDIWQQEGMETKGTNTNGFIAEFLKYKYGIHMCMINLLLLRSIGCFSFVDCLF